jgi:succinate-semialdehyde dehydrogenase/glutarate-semialdehyde dehydrogenase
MTETLSSVVAGGRQHGAEVFELRSPASGELLAHVRAGDPETVDAAVSAAREAFATTRWAGLAERVGWCERAAAAIEERAGGLAAELAEEQGKPLHEATGEIAAGVRGFRLAAEAARGLDGYSPPVEDFAKRVVVIRQPRGVWAVLTPWNFPFNIPIEYLGPAVATGSPVIWKPAPTCARIASRLVDLLHGAGVPPGLVNLVLTDDVAVAQGLVTHRGVDAVGLTGGTRTGEAVARAAWDKHLLLELGGNGPVIVLDDADMERASAAVASAAFTNAGQVCSAAGRVLVAGAVADELADALTRSAGAIVLGAPDQEGVTMGPVHTEAVAATMDRHIADALAHGATVRAGGRRAAGHPTELYYEPTVLDDVPVTAEVAMEETFGPIAPLVRSPSDEELLQVANASEHGLVAAVFTRSLQRAWHFAERLESGSVVVNDTSNYWELHLPFGGRAGRSSGRGRLGGRHTLDEFTELKTISFDIS